MKQSLIILVFLFCYYSCLSQDKTYQHKFTYTFSFKPYKNKELVLNQQMLLLTNKKESLFFSKQKPVLDSLRREYKNDFYAFLEAKKKLPKNYVDYIIYKNFNKNNYTYQNKYLTDIYKYSENIPKLIWSLQKSYKNVLGHSCQLATTTFKGRNYSAWFAKNIPLQDGPYKFSGLPGLILEIYDAKNIFHFIIIGIKNENQISPNVFAKKVFIIDKRDEANFRLGVENSIINMAIGDSRLLIKKKFEELKKYAIPIELDNY